VYWFVTRLTGNSDANPIIAAPRIKACRGGGDLAVFSQFQEAGNRARRAADYSISCGAWPIWAALGASSGLPRMKARGKRDSSARQLSPNEEGCPDVQPSRLFE